MGQTISSEEARQHVARLYEFVMNRTATSEREMEHWTARLVETGDPIRIFNEFALCQENTARRELESVTATMYPNGHFYSPVVNRAEAEADLAGMVAKRSLRGLDLNAEVQVRMFKDMSRRFDSLPFSDEATATLRYRFNNTSYGFGDALIYWSMLASWQPRRIIEVGSGFTSALALDAIEVLGLETECQFIDPYPQLAEKVVGDLGTRHRIVPQRIQDVDPDIVLQLKARDILFIDSSHVVKTGSDVHFEMTELLPRLASGVIVHFHDVFYPFEYPKKWVVEDNKSWNELYALHHFLLYNTEFQILYFNDYFAKQHRTVIEQFAPKQAARIAINPGGGLWLLRR